MWHQHINPQTPTDDTLLNSSLLNNPTDSTASKKHFTAFHWPDLMTSWSTARLSETRKTYSEWFVFVSESRRHNATHASLTVFDVGHHCWRTSHLSSQRWGSAASPSCPGSGFPPYGRCSCPAPDSGSETGWPAGRWDTHLSFCATDWCSNSRSYERSSEWRPAGDQPRWWQLEASSIQISSNTKQRIISFIIIAFKL